MAGFEVCGAVDIDEDALSVYETNLCDKDLSTEGISGRVSFDSPMEADLEDTTFSEICERFDLDPDDVDVICGCPPCQNFSTLRDTDPWPEDEPKDTLLRAFVDRIREAKPHFVFFENVPGILTAGDGEDAPTTYIDWFQSSMRHITREGDSRDEGGYGINLRVVNAADYGVPQRRRRTVGLCAYGVEDDAIEFPERTHAEDPGSDSVEEWKTVGETILGEESDLKIDLDLGETQVGIEGYPDDPAHRSRRHHDSTVEMIRAIRCHGDSWMDLRGTVDEDLIKDCHRGMDSGARAAYGIMSADKPSPTLTTRCTNISSGRFTHPTQNRAITFREAALLMTFPSWFELPSVNKTAERVVGNAVPAMLVRQLADGFRRIDASHSVGMFS